MSLNIGQPVSTKIPTPNGYKLMGDLKVGDKVFGSNGQPVTVTGVFPQGIKDIYEITFNDGRKAQCCKDQPWLLIPWLRTQKFFTLENMLKDFKKYANSRIVANDSDGCNREPYIYKYRLSTVPGPVNYYHKDTSIHPYVLGTLLGDGTFRSKTLRIAAENEFIPNQVSKICDFYYKKYPGNEYDYYFHSNKTGKAIITKDFLKDIPELLGVFSKDKFIPQEYIFNDVNTRLWLLKGLLDADGSIISPTPSQYVVTYASTSKSLINQIQYIVRSLGFNASIHLYSNAEKFSSGFAANLYIQVPNNFKKELFLYPRKLYQANKAATIPDRKNYSKIIIKDIKLSHKCEVINIITDSNDGSYLTDNFIVIYSSYIKKEV